MAVCEQAAKNPCEDAAETWKIKQLFLDLEVVFKKLSRDSKGLENWQKQYLCLLLSGYTPRQIAQEHLHLTVESLRVKLSAKRGLYDCIRKLTKQSISDWRDVIILLLNSGYRRNEGASPDREETMLFMTCDVEVSESLLRKLEATIQEVTGSNNLRIVRIENGSVVFVWQGSLDACRQVENLFQSGQLDRVLEFPVANVQVEDVPALSKSQPVVSLSQWLQGIFEPSWQPVEWVMAPRLRMAALPLAPDCDIPTDIIKRSKVICWDTDDREFALVVHLIETTTQSIDIRIQIHPGDRATDLPPDLQLSVQDASGVTCLEATARTADNWLQLEFGAEPGEHFSVAVTVGSVRAVEHFSI